jgi:Rrf2 family protein
MLTNKGKYGLKALVYLARLPPGETAFGADIAEANRIPRKFLEAILLEMRNNGLIRSKKGPGGGYALAIPPDKISIGRIVRAIDGPIAPIRCASRTAYQPCDDCESVATCTVRLAMLEVRDAMAAVLDRTTLAELAQRPKTRQRAATAAALQPRR